MALMGHWALLPWHASASKLAHATCIACMSYHGPATLGHGPNGPYGPTALAAALLR